MTTYWADHILNMSNEEREKANFGPYIVIPTTGSLRLLNEIISRTPRDKRRAWPSSPSPGWMNLGSAMAWVSLGSEDFYKAGMAKRVYVHDQEIIPSTNEEAFQFVLQGKAFPFCGDVFLLPDDKNTYHTYTYHVPDKEPLTFFYGYRGHTRNWPRIVTPSIFHDYQPNNREHYIRFKNRSIYASNIIKQVFWERQGIGLQDIQANGILQHHKVIGDTDILDISYDINVAKWFSLNRYDQSTNSWQTKRFLEKTNLWDAYDEASFVYLIIVRVLGLGTLPMILPGDFALDDAFGKHRTGEQRNNNHLMPWNLSPLYSNRPNRQKGFGVRGLQRNDYDPYGMVLSVCEFRFHPVFFPNGWDNIGGPEISYGGRKWNYDQDSSNLSLELFASEEDWFILLCSQIQEGLAKVGLQ